MKELPLNLKNIRDFFNLIYYQNNATQEEIHNFLHECLKYTFEENGFDMTEFDLTIHNKVKNTLIKCDAQMIADDNNPNKFDFYFKDKFFKVAKQEDVDSFMYPLYVFFHEIGHMFQYILTAEEMLIYDEEKFETELAVIDLDLKKHKTRKERLLKKALDKFANAQRIICPPEKDANKQSYLYLKDLILTLINYEQDPDLAEYFITLYQDLQYMRKQEFDWYRKYSKFNRDAAEVLKQHSLDYDLAVLAKN